MEQSITQQVKQTIDHSKQILIVLPNLPSTDAIAAGLGLYMTLEQAGKKVKVVCNKLSMPPQHMFLPKSKVISSDLVALRKFVITLNTSKTKAEELSYEMNDDRLDIFITPRGQGYFNESDITTSASGYEYDLIITLDAANLEALGLLYDKNTEFFYRTPIINIDHNPSNEYYGQIDFVDLTATSVSEIIFELIQDWESKKLDEYIATSLLAGIISKTKSFKSSSVTPKSLSIASHLVSSGARRDDIVRHLYQNHSLSTLKLWGRALARLKEDMNKRLVWSLVNNNDFEQSGGTTDDIAGVIDDLMVNTPEAELIVLIYGQTPSQTKALISSHRTVNALQEFKKYKPSGSKHFITLDFPNKKLEEVESELIKHARTILAKK
ncbi:bifunctional oligoribonuclease/PAP phosphatase NrnA [Patescibacteria group bacterium]